MAAAIPLQAGPFAFFRHLVEPLLSLTGGQLLTVVLPCLRSSQSMAFILRPAPVSTDSCVE